MKHRGIITPTLMHAGELLRDDDLYATLGEFILGRKAGREDENERIHFAHTGIEAMGLSALSLTNEMRDHASE